MMAVRNCLGAASPQNLPSRKRRVMFNPTILDEVRNSPTLQGFFEEPSEQQVEDMEKQIYYDRGFTDGLKDKSSNFLWYTIGFITGMVVVYNLF